MNPKDRSGSKKPNLSILPLRPLYEAAIALYEGSRKYGPWNWRKEKVDEVIYVDAAIRHLHQYLSREDIDPDSGLHHVTKAIAGLIVLRDAQHHGCSIDTRREKQDVDFPDLVQRIEAVNQKYPNPVGEPQPEPVANDVSWVITVAGGGSYVISKRDEGALVRFRNGRQDLIERFIDDEVYTWVVRTHQSTAHNRSGWYTYYVRGTTPDTCPEDIVAVLVPTEAVQAPTGNVTTVAGGGSYELSSKDVGKSVRLRNGRTATLVRYVACATSYPVYAKHADTGITFTASVSGNYWVDSYVDEDDIVEVIS